MNRLSHLDDQGRATMVDVSGKDATTRTASAEAVIVLSEAAYELVTEGKVPKGDVLATARIAGIMAAKKTSELIPLCHPLALSHAGIEFEALSERHAFRIIASAKTTGQTGVEMEAMTAASIAALTFYDMIKAVDKSAVIESVRLLSKDGGKSGSYAVDAPAVPQTVKRAGARASNPRPVSPREFETRETAARETGKPQPRALMHETSAPRIAPTNDREALRTFMVGQRLRATEWAKSAGLPVNELYGFLSGRSRALHPETAERLAKAARTTVDAMFGRKPPR